MPNKEPNRVELATTEKAAYLITQLQQYGITKDDLHILFVAIKHTDELFVHAKNKSDDAYQLIATYSISQRSGLLGPKKAEGDKQVPEGLYHINRFNPKSKYYLSLGINYPNAYDLDKEYTGSDIFIHGGAESQGCLPVTDDKMKELYLYALWATEAGQQHIPIYIFPFPMQAEEMEKQQATASAETYTFWKNLQEAYTEFQQQHRELSFTIVNGRYKIY